MSDRKISTLDIAELNKIFPKMAEAMNYQAAQQAEKYVDLSESEAAVEEEEHDDQKRRIDPVHDVDSQSCGAVIAETPNFSDLMRLPKRNAKTSGRRGKVIYKEKIGKLNVIVNVTHGIRTLTLRRDDSAEGNPGR